MPSAKVVQLAHPDSEISNKRQSRAHAEEVGVKFATAAGAKSIRELRAKPAAELLKLSLDESKFSFHAVVDGAVLPQDVNADFRCWQPKRPTVARGLDRR